MTRRRMLSGAVLAVCVVLGVVVGFMIQRTESPTQAALDAAPPSPSVLTAKVTSEVVRSTVVGRGTVEAATPLTVAVPPADAASGRQVLSQIPQAPGSSVDAGNVLAEVSGRPVILLRGGVTPYRDLAYGDVGTDVDQLQAGLRDLGYGASDSGRIDAATCAAVRQVYIDRHYSVPADPAAASPAAPAAVDPAAAADAPATVPAAAQVPSSCQGLRIPLGEWWFVPDLPQTVIAFQVAVGKQLDSAKPLATLSGRGLTLGVSLSAELAASVTTGMAAEIETGSAMTPGTVAGVQPAASGSDGGAPTQARVMITPATDLAANTVGSSLKVTIVRSQTDQPVLAVPISAIWTSPDGTVFVIRRDAEGRQDRVTVTPGVVGDQSVQVTPGDGVSLAVDDTVVIGS